MENSRPSQPPIAGAELECLFGYHNLDLKHVAPLCKAALRSGLRLRSTEPFVAADTNYLHWELPRIDSLDDFLLWLQRSLPARMFLRLNGRLHDAEAPISLSVHLPEKVVTLSVPEVILWDVEGEKENLAYERLDAFFELCAAIAAVHVPSRAAIGSEPCHVDEISVHNPDSSRFVFEPITFFSQRHRKDLFDWYRKVYANRWNQPFRID